ncbi:unnamed protein product, partial [Ranitomeya imitator]
MLGVAKSTVGYILRKKELTGELGNSKRPGRPRMTTVVDDRRILNLVKKNPFTTSTEVQNTLSEVGVSVSKSTVKRRLHDSKYKGFTSRCKPFINTKNRQARVKFAEKHLKKPAQFWKSILWTDETKINLYQNDGKKKVWRRKGTAHDPRHTTSSVKHGGGNIQPNAAKLIGRRFIVQMDNDPKHTAKATQEFMSAKKWNILQWPSQSPDLNPIEHAFHLLKSRLKTERPTNKQDLKAAAVKAWQSIKKEETQRLVMSMGSRLKAKLKTSAAFAYGNDLPKKRPSQIYKPSDPETLAYLDFSVSTTGMLAGVKMSHAATSAFCRSIKLQCELYPSREVAICLDPYCGLGFVLWCLCSVYSGHQSILIPPSELEINPALWLLAVSQYKVRDTFCSYSVMELCTKGLGLQTESLK